MNQITELFTEHNRKIATGISVVLVIIMSLSVANTVLFVLENMNPPSVIPSSSPTTQSESSSRTFKVSNMELFGKAEERSTVQEVIDAPETKLNLELQGVFIAEDESRSTAIVGTKQKAGELYEIGDKLPGNATLAAVFEDHVYARNRKGTAESMASLTRDDLTAYVRDHFAHDNLQKYRHKIEILKRQKFLSVTNTFEKMF